LAQDGVEALSQAQQHDINVSFKGSTAWNAIMFWRYYTLSMDKKHLAEVVYPVLAASADYCFASLHLRADGKYSIKDSACPEQAFSDVEGVYDRCLFEALFIETNPCPAHAALRKMGINVGVPRLPLVDITEETSQKINKVLEELELLNI